MRAATWTEAERLRPTFIAHRTREDGSEGHAVDKGVDPTYGLSVPPCCPEHGRCPSDALRSGHRPVLRRERVKVNLSSLTIKGVAGVKRVEVSEERIQRA